MVVTPEVAEQLLEQQRYIHNRPISQPWVAYLARQMTDGLWRMNGEPLIFSNRGKLLNGQHRLSAVSLSGKTITFAVVRGVDAATFTTMDQNRVRSAGQVLTMNGEKNGFLVAALCRKIYCWKHEGHLGGKMKISPDELSQVLTDHPELRDSVEVAKKIQAQVPVDGSMVAFCHWLFNQAAPRKSSAFFETLESAVASQRNDPAIVLRTRFFKEREANRRWGGTELLAIFVRAWNYYAKGETVAKLAIKPDKDGTYHVPAVFGLGPKQGLKGVLSQPSDE
jgi:hypothetical protein